MSFFQYGFLLTRRGKGWGIKENTYVVMRTKKFFYLHYTYYTDFFLIFYYIFFAIESIRMRSMARTSLAALSGKRKRKTFLTIRYFSREKMH